MSISVQHYMNVMNMTSRFVWKIRSINLFHTFYDSAIYYSTSNITFYVNVCYTRIVLWFYSACIVFSGY